MAKIEVSTPKERIIKRIDDLIDQVDKVYKDAPDDRNSEINKAIAMQSVLALQTARQIVKEEL
jgi:hypothetical protein